MDALVMVLFVVITAAVWWWLARLMSKKGRNWFLRHLTGSGLGIFAGFVFVALAIEVGVISAPQKTEPTANIEQSADIAPALTAETPVAEPEPVSPPALVQPSIEAPVKSLGMTAKEYAARLNTMLQKADRPQRIDGLNITKGDVNNVLQEKIGTYTALVATLSKTSNEVLSVTLIGTGDGSDKSGLEIMMIATAVMAAAAPTAEYSDLLTGLPEMIKGQDRTYGAVKLSVMPMNEMGTWFMAEPI
ncbi:hypothetical protein [Pseudomonas sp.]|uniref:hypothetical protein n=1 Tax=Pseudomonas sp. TaxID=306 RepID=UPI002580D633|nr:hypothetical protein [Pseudomonas sp.]